MHPAFKVRYSLKTLKLKEFRLNQTLHYTRRIMPKRVTSLRCSSPRHSTRQQSYFHRCWSGGESLVTLCKIWRPKIWTPDLSHIKPDWPIEMLLLEFLRAPNSHIPRKGSGSTTTMRCWSLDKIKKSDIGFITIW